MALASRELQQQRFPANPPCVRPHKSKRVTWAPEGSLCQIRLFLSEDAPQQSGLLASQELLQAKTSSSWHLAVSALDDTAPPGFEGPRSAWQLKKDLSKIHVIKWQCPPKFVISPAWHVVAGEESKEIEVQNQRQLRVLEAVYPRPSSIPPSPSVAPEAQEDFNDRLTPLIPLTPVEEDETTEVDSATPTSFLDPSLSVGLPTVAQAPSSSLADLRSVGERSLPCKPSSANMNAPATSTVTSAGAPAVEPDVAVAASAASAAFTAIMKSNEEGSLIDQDLLIKILSNPALLEKLVTQYGVTSPMIAGLAPAAKSMTPSVSKPQLTSTAQLAPPSLVNRPDVTRPLASQPTEHHYPKLNPMPTMPNLRQPSPVVPVNQVRLNPSVPPVKDVNYYKSLIQQHGNDKPSALEPDPAAYVKHHNQPLVPGNPDVMQKPRDGRMKIGKPCVYHNSPKGCWHGSNCVYLHDDAPRRQIREMPEAPNAKRVKMDREITGRS
ncbi:zinc finger CCCH domain-containing protein 6-like [Nymphaea colorata]|nr:zinc finger CCCH domain-containing protein 6-like [Nymphaea colorata]